MNRKAIELSMNFLVIIVLSLVIFGFSINFIMNIYGKATGLQQRTFEDLDRQIGTLRCGTEQVCIGDKTKTIRRGEYDAYGVRILNIFAEERKFKVTIVPNGAVNSQIDPKFGTEGHELFLLPAAGQERIESISPDKSRNFALGVEVGKSLASGTYVVDVLAGAEKLPRGTGFEPYGETPKYKIIVVVP
ncbi:hypothetical protein HY639_01735 [Candidatus Woesearchaeota archaeon]|nr:hypothetical protein [Candidatus Woesearchaeota archaeon]